MFKSQVESPGQKGITMVKGTIKLSAGQVTINTEDGQTIRLKKPYWVKQDRDGDISVHPLEYEKFNVLYGVFRELIDAVNSDLNFKVSYGLVRIEYEAESRKLHIQTECCYENIIL